MVRVLVTGANGFIGGATALALRKAGHQVYGLVRDEKQKAELLQNEIIPVLGDLSDIKGFASTLDKVNVVIDNVAIFTEEKIGQSNRNLLDALISASKGKAKKRYIYTSGILVYNYNELVDESYPTNGIFKWRTELEHHIIKTTDVDGVVVRPGFVYGGSGGMISDIWFSGGEKDDIEFHGSTEKSWGWIHVSDLAEAYVRVVEASHSLVAGEIFDVCDSTRITSLQARTLFARAAGRKGKVVVKEAGKDGFSQALEATAVPRAQKIQKYLGWAPKLGPFPDDIDLYYQSWKAHQDKKKANKEEKKEKK